LGQVPEKSGQVVLADFEQHFIPALARASAVACETAIEVQYDNYCSLN